MIIRSQEEDESWPSDKGSLEKTSKAIVGTGLSLKGSLIHGKRSINDESRNKDVSLTRTTILTFSPGSRIPSLFVSITVEQIIIKHRDLKH